MGGAFRVSKEHSSFNVQNHCQQWPSFWGKALDCDASTSMRTSSFLHGNKCPHEGFNW